jgi:hypothetical protein
MAIQDFKITDREKQRQKFNITEDKRFLKKDTFSELLSLGNLSNITNLSLEEFNKRGEKAKAGQNLQSLSRDLFGDLEKAGSFSGMVDVFQDETTTGVTGADIDAIISAFQARQGTVGAMKESGGRSNSLLTGNLFR